MIPNPDCCPKCRLMVEILEAESRGEKVEISQQTLAELDAFTH